MVSKQSTYLFIYLFILSMVVNNGEYSVIDRVSVWLLVQVQWPGF